LRCKSVSDFNSPYALTTTTGRSAAHGVPVTGELYSKTKKVSRMKKSIMLLSVLALASAPAMADDGYWPGRSPNTPTLGDSNGGISTADAEANRAYYAALRARIVAEGGCNANDLPYWVEQGCDGAPFVKATDGGGDGGSSGGNGSGSGTSGEGSSK
jgi:uncharacterized membrane protein YgcG